MATGFSMKMCLPASTAASNCIGRKPGGVARITMSTPLSISLLVGVEADELAIVGHVDLLGVCPVIVALRFLSAPSSRSSEKASAMATSLTFALGRSGPVDAAPVPRPPQPIRADLDHVVAGGVGAVPDAQGAGQGRAGRHGRRALEEVAAEALLLSLMLVVLLGVDGITACCPAPRRTP